MEKLQFDDIETLINSLAFYSVVAWQLLALTYILREEPDQSASILFEPNEVILLQKLSSKKIISVHDAVLALAQIVGFAPSKKQPYPGVKVLATAIERFFFYFAWFYCMNQNPYKISRRGTGGGFKGGWGDQSLIMQEVYCS